MKAKANPLHRSLLILIISIIMLPCTGYAQENKNNPQPQPDDFILPMPGDRIMVFRPVCIGKGGGSYAWKQIRLGDGSGGYKETPVSLALGGSFPVQDKHGEDWCYYIGKYEVSEDQLQAVLQDQPNKAGSQYPAHKISWFEVENFIQKYNSWLYENASEKIPEYGDIPGYIRLPTETEWEFAARGGSNVTAAEFDRKTPYPNRKIAGYEWFSGPKSSHNKLKKIGKLKPNPLGLHDILGNVMEMTRSLYQIEYYQGRSGGFVAKGGHYFTDSKQLRSSLRIEQPFYSLNSKSKKIEPASQKTLGFRLLISSLVFPNRQASIKMKTDWEPYHKGVAQELPAAASTSPISNQTRIVGIEATSQLENIKKELADSGVLSGELEQQMNNLAASLDEIQFTVQKAEKDSAYALVKIIGQQAYFIYTQSLKHLPLQALKESAKLYRREKVYEAYVLREKEIVENIEKTLESYTESIRELGKVNTDAIEDAFVKYGDYLRREINTHPDQINIIEPIKRHTKFYITNDRINDAGWKADLVSKKTWGDK